MAYYSREEQETLYLYDPRNDSWQVHSTYKPHIRKILEYARVTDRQEDGEGRVILAAGYVDANQVRLFKPRR